MSLSILNKKILIIGASSSIGSSILKFDKKKNLLELIFEIRKKTYLNLILQRRKFLKNLI